MSENKDAVNQNFSCLGIGDKAPSFEADSTLGKISFPVDFEGHWVILFSHPSDFSAVCTTEFIFFAEVMKEFERLNTKLLGLSVDGLASHLEWLYKIETEISFHGITNTKIKFPLIADLSGEIASKYGMIHPNISKVKAVRSVFFVDPNGIIRAILFYPFSTGRNFDELKRVLISLQLSDKLNISTPANWQPGDDIVPKAPDNINEVNSLANDVRNKSGAWFLSLEELSKEDIEIALHSKRQKFN